DLAIAIELLQIFRRRYEGHVHRPAERTFTKLHYSYSIAGCLQFAEVAVDLVCIGQLVIVARRKSEMFLWDWNGRIHQRRAGYQRQNYEDAEDADFHESKSSKRK